MQETTILQQHLVRPGDRLVLYSLVTVVKLAVSAGRHRFFVPMDHPETFSVLDDADAAAAPGPGGRLDQLVSASSTFPLLLRLADTGRNYVNFHEEVLPRETTLRAEVGLLTRLSDAHCFKMRVYVRI